MSEAVWVALIVAIPTFLGSIWAAIKGVATALRWWAEREEARITNDLLGKQAIATVEEKNREILDLKEQLRQCLSRNGLAS